MRLTLTKIANVLAAHSIQRVTAREVSLILRRPALTVAPGTAHAARAHITAVAERLNLVNRQIKTITRRLDGLVEQIAGPEASRGKMTSGGTRRSCAPCRRWEGLSSLRWSRVLIPTMPPCHSEIMPPYIPG